MGEVAGGVGGGEVGFICDMSDPVHLYHFLVFRGACFSMQPWKSENGASAVGPPQHSVKL